MENKNLYQKMFKVMEAIEFIKKDTHIQFKGTDYHATSEETITPIFRKEFIENKLMVFPIEQESYKSNGISRLDVKYKIVDIESGESEILASSGEGSDTQDKGAGKAMTYAYKYMLLRTFMIPTGEDPDKIPSGKIDDDLKRKKEPPKAITVPVVKDNNKSNGKMDELLDLAFTSEVTRKAFVNSFKGTEKEMEKILRERIDKEVA